MPEIDDILIGLVLGLGLAAACGFRVFVPMLVMCLGARAGYFEPASGFAWISSTPALCMLIAATVVEVVAYYVPWLDNALDTIATPAAAIAGTLVAAAVLSGMDPAAQWSLALIAGGGAATGVQLTTVGTRATSTASTGGLANPVVSTVEAGTATGVSLAVVFLPAIIAAIIVLVLFAVVGVFLFRRLRRRRGEQPAP
jgi:hypothetical protein